MSLIKLEIAIDYPIQWEFSRVYRDLIQNFYDSVGPEHFHEEFQYEWFREEEGYHVIMKTKDHPFSYELLAYVGGSTKTEAADTYIGKYGEGFKMAALRIMQMGGMRLKMHSQHWMIEPASYFEDIDGKKISMLGYDYTEVEADQWSKLEITKIPEEYKEVLSEALLDFFYEENPLFGSKIGAGEKWSLYHRSSMEIPCRQYSPDLTGILYVNNLARGRLDIPVIICYRTELSYDSRSRETFDDDKTRELLHEILRCMDPSSSLELLLIMEKEWNAYPKGINDTETKYYMICQLVRNVAKDEVCVEAFQRQYTNLAYIERKKSDTRRNKIIDETSVWAKGNSSKRLVNPIFRLLGAESLVEKYIKINENNYRLPDLLESKRMEIVYEAVKATVPLRLTDQIPELVINKDESVPFEPLQFSEKNYSRKRGEKTRKYNILKIGFRHSDFADDAFQNTFIKLADAMLHIYGTSKSARLNAILTHLGGWILDKKETIALYEHQWINVSRSFSTTS